MMYFVDAFNETVGITEEEILPFLKEKDHPALKMDSIVG